MSLIYTPVDSRWTLSLTVHATPFLRSGEGVGEVASGIGAVCNFFFLRLIQKKKSCSSGKEITRVCHEILRTKLNRVCFSFFLFLSKVVDVL
jgi:hypothetical protein